MVPTAFGDTKPPEVACRLPPGGDRANEPPPSARHRYGRCVTTTEPDRHLALDGCFNFRDLGGYATSDGRVTRWRRLFRADGPHALTEADAAVVAELDLTTILDLRTGD